MNSEADPAPDIAAVDELRFLADSLRRVDAAVAAAQWDDDVLSSIVSDARAELSSVRTTIDGDIATAAASTAWRTRAEDYLRDVASTPATQVPPAQARADAAVAVALARAAVAEARLSDVQRDRDHWRELAERLSQPRPSIWTRFFSRD